jgi:hypothetical protein
MQPPVSFKRLLGLGAVLIIVSLSARAQDNFDSEWNHFGLNLRTGFNVETKFSEPPVNGGYVKPDSSGSESTTWNWGYNSPSVISGGNLQINNTSAASDHSSQNPNVGYDFNYIRDITHDTWGQLGIKFGIGYSPINVNLNGISATATSTDYSLGGITAPASPYRGTYNGPGPIIDSTPTSVGSSVVTLPGTHNLDAALFDLRLGPAVNVPMSRRFSVQASAGLALGIIDSHFTFSDSAVGAPVTPPPPPVETEADHRNLVSSSPLSGGDTHTAILPGAYVEVGFAYRMTRSASVYTGAQFEYLGDFSQSAGGRSADIQLGATIFYELGLQFHF